MSRVQSLGRKRIRSDSYKHAPWVKKAGITKTTLATGDYTRCGINYASGMGDKKALEIYGTEIPASRACITRWNCLLCEVSKFCVLIAGTTPQTERGAKPARRSAKFCRIGSQIDHK